MRGVPALAGVALNATLLLLPALLAGRAGAWLALPAVRLFLVGASLLCLGDLLHAPPASLAHAGPDAATSRRAWATALALLLTFWTALATCTSGPASSAAGFALMAAGAALRAAAIRRLGAFFVTAVRVVPGQPLERHGVYARMRHPSETGLLLAALGGCVLLGSAPAAAVWLLVLLPLVRARIRREDAVLARAFGDAHRDYTRSVAALLPVGGLGAKPRSGGKPPVRRAGLCPDRIAEVVPVDGPGSSTGGRNRRVSSR